ncbi:MAG: 4'-phosphopantetheinyl transferase superfamily protein [Myxococcales bacterium]|nr:4'-phosphopantetheinyl transferase superfamily protein [Myxococcales bacterium]
MTAPFALELAHGRAVAVAVDDAVDGNHPDERVAAARYRDGRAREFLAGRRALRAAIAELGLAPALGPIDADPRGAPLLPPEVVGSISHKATLAIALAAPAQGWTIGIDLELRAPRATDISRRVLTPPEQAALAHLVPDEQRRAVVRTFAIKEAVYKAIDPYLGRYVGFHEVALRDPRADAAIVEVPDAWGLEVEVACAAHDAHWIATARARRR